LARILENGDTSSNVVLQPGDVVTVPHAGIVYALGAVTRPGGFVVSNDRGQLTTLKLLSLAGVSITPPSPITLLSSATMAMASSTKWKST